MSKNPTIEELKETINSIDVEQLNNMKPACINQAKLFDKSIFFAKFDSVLDSI
jgi:hypothetical protein